MRRTPKRQHDARAAAIAQLTTRAAELLEKRAGFLRAAWFAIAVAATMMVGTAAANGFLPSTPPLGAILLFAPLLPGVIGITCIVAAARARWQAEGIDAQIRRLDPERRLFSSPAEELGIDLRTALLARLDERYGPPRRKRGRA